MENSNQPNSGTKMEDNQNGRRAKWKTTKINDEQNWSKLELLF